MMTLDARFDQHEKPQRSSDNGFYKGCTVRQSAQNKKMQLP